MTNTRSYNRLDQFVEHNPDMPYLSHGPYSKVAWETGLSPATVSRLRHNKVGNPSFRTMCRITEFFERHYRRPMDPREIFYPRGSFRPNLTFEWGALVRRRPTAHELATQTERNYNDDLDVP